MSRLAGIYETTILWIGADGAAPNTPAILLLMVI
jgi:hypothetical protein